jgi:raffinose/stachyose/melibiose transport system substrate-binding protein
MKRRFGVVLAICLCISLVLTACGGGTSSGNTPNEENKAVAENESASQEEVVLKFPSFRTGQNVAAKSFIPQVERFNAKYAGKYKIVLEEIPQDAYYQKIKLLGQQNKLPPIIEDGERDFMKDVVVPNEMFYDLKPFIDEHPDLKKLLIEDSVKYNTTESGKIVSVPHVAMSPIGLFYNKEMFEKAGITKPISQMNFEEFDQALEALKQAGFTPLSLMTGENTWTTMLLATAFMANQPGGLEVLASTRTDKTYDFTDPLWVNTFAEVQKWFQNYTTDNAIGGVYADAANNFLNERTAIIANGPWMVPDFSDTSKAAEGLEKKIGASIYPGGVIIASLNEYRWWLPKGLKEEETEAALAFLEFIHTPEELEQDLLANGGIAPHLETSADFDSKQHPIVQELRQVMDSDLKQTVQYIQAIWPAQIDNPEFGKYLPLLVDGKLTPEQFAEKLTEIAQQFKD